MTSGAKPMPRGLRAGRQGLRNLGNPLDFIAEDHLRHREICAMIDALALAERPDHAAMDEVLEFLEHEFALHVEEEEQDLHVLMRRKCTAEDAIDITLKRLVVIHQEAAKTVVGVRGSLVRALVGKAGFSALDKKALTQFAAQERRHLIVENAILLPLARARLKTRELDELRMKMLRRRGLDKLLVQQSDGKKST